MPYAPQVIFDIGMFDGSDTGYYLDLGARVVAVEANPALVERAAHHFAGYVETGMLKLLNVAVSDVPGIAELTICGSDLGSSSIYAERLVKRHPLGTYKVPAVTLTDLIAKEGVPDFLKIDIEGADRVCVLSLTAHTAPRYLSFEAHGDLEEMVRHAASIGYTGFKIINQVNFLSLQNQDSFKYRAVQRLIGLLGYGSPSMAKRAGRYFKLEHSAGPAPWESDGSWYSADAIVRDWRTAVENGDNRAWYDVHAVK